MQKDVVLHSFYMTLKYTNVRELFFPFTLVGDTDSKTLKKIVIYKDLPILFCNLFQLKQIL